MMQAILPEFVEYPQHLHALFSEGNLEVFCFFDHRLMPPLG